MTPLSGQNTPKGTVCTLSSSTKHTRNACTTTSRITCFYVIPGRPAFSVLASFFLSGTPLLAFRFCFPPPSSSPSLSSPPQTLSIFAIPPVSIFPHRDSRSTSNRKHVGTTRAKKKTEIVYSSPETKTQSSPDYFPEIYVSYQKPASLQRKGKKKKKP